MNFIACTVAVFSLRERFPLLSDEKSQHVEFFGTEMDALTTHLHYSSLKIDTQLRAFELRKRFFRTGPSQGRSNTCQEFAYCEGFYDVIVGSGIESMNLVLFRISDGDHDDRTSEGQSNLAACFKPAHAGHVHIQQNQVRVLAHNHFDGLASGMPSSAAHNSRHARSVSGRWGQKDWSDRRCTFGLIISWNSRSDQTEPLFCEIQNLMG